MSESSHIELAYASIEVFADDGKLDLEELEHLMAIALADKIISEDEKMVLRNIFDSVNETNASKEVLNRIAEIRKKYSKEQTEFLMNPQ